MTRGRIVSLAAGIALSGMLGCASPRPPAEGAAEGLFGGPADALAAEPRIAVGERQIALDFANAIAQLIDAEATSLALPPAAERSDEPVFEALLAILGQAGYTLVEGADATADDRALAHRVVAGGSGGEPARRHELAVGDVRLRRSYRVGEAGAVAPTSAMFVQGGDAGALRLMDGRLFGTAGEDDGPSALPDALLARHGQLLNDTATLTAPEGMPRDGGDGIAVRSSEVRATDAERRIAIDLANAVSQLIDADAAPLAFAPDARTDPEPVFAVLRAVLGEAGYTLVYTADSAAGKRAVSYRAVATEGEGEPAARRHELAVGALQLRRSYRVDEAGAVEPTSALFVRGVDRDADPDAPRLIDGQLFGTDEDDGTPPAPAGSLLARYAGLLDDGAARPPTTPPADGGARRRADPGADTGADPGADPGAGPGAGPAAGPAAVPPPDAAPDGDPAMASVGGAPNDRRPPIPTPTPADGGAGRPARTADAPPADTPPDGDPAAAGVDGTPGANGGEPSMPTDGSLARYAELLDDAAALGPTSPSPDGGARRPAEPLAEPPAVPPSDAAPDDDPGVASVDAAPGADDGPSLPPSPTGGLLTRYAELLDGVAAATPTRAPADGGARRPAEPPAESLAAPSAVPAPGGDPVAGSACGTPGADGAEGVNAPAGNVRDLGGSNYASWLDDLEPVLERELVFELGSSGLAADQVPPIEALATRFDAASDVVSVIGYSIDGDIGPDLNRALALERADCVRRVLTEAGVPAERIFIEAYWSGVRREAAPPPRAAIVSLRRHAG